jgi:hypothetical protein
MDYLQGLRLRYAEKIQQLLHEEQEEQAKLKRNLAAKGMAMGGAAAAGFIRIKKDYAERRLLAFVESVGELVIDLRHSRRLEKCEPLKAVVCYREPLKVAHVI